MDDQENMKLSIVIPTVGRTKELDNLLESIEKAKLDFRYEIIIIDQNDKFFLDNIINKYNGKLPIIHEIVSFKGLSKAKNQGVKLASGQFISFPDDDSKILHDTYQNAFVEIENNNLDMVFGKCIDEKGIDSVLNFKKEPTFLNQQNMLGGFVEATVISKTDILKKWNFDENMGAGCFFGAEEGYDWLYRILTESTSLNIMYSPRIQFFHPQVILSKGDESSLNRVFKYRCGTAYLCVKHDFRLKLTKRIWLSRIASLIYYPLDRKKASYYNVEKNALQLGKEFAKLKLNK
ncbi:glycosyltransferase family 2 protein [Chryseobacterium sp. MIQD13]|uniref:glycosyltransferase family 2 protein n=1 Tax=Chryseobacterium sp. MIQD13 TaxID=3422310 RepID=UPI003D2D9A53